MLSCQQFELASERRETTGLDLDQQVATDEIDDETIDHPFDAIVRPLVPALELSVQRTLVERSDRRDLSFLGSGELVDGMHDDAPFCVAAQLPSPGHRPGRAAAPLTRKERLLQLAGACVRVFALSRVRSRLWLSQT